MKQFEKIQKEIDEFDNALEIAGYLDGINAAAICYCSQKCPDEVYHENGLGSSKVTICGMVDFLDSDVQSDQ